MPQLAELPNETLGHIMTFFLCDDIDNFSACCKHFKALSTVYHPKHKEMKRQYSCVTLGTPRYRVFGPFGHPANFFEALLRDLTVASYVKTLCVHSAEYRSFSSRIKSLGKEAQDIVKSLPYLTVHEKFKCIQHLLKGDRNWLVALILTLLPFLRKLKLTIHEPGNRHLSMIPVQELLIAASRVKRIKQIMLLSKLTHVKFSSCILQPKLIHLFGGLPSMRSFRAKTLLDINEKWSAFNSGSTLTNLSLGQGQIGLESLRRILDSIAALQGFTYGFDTFFESGGSVHEKAPIEPKDIVQCLLRSASHSLKSLDLTLLGFRQWDIEIEKNRLMGSLQGFQVLKRIRVSHIMFVEHVPPWSAHVIRTRSIADVIPASLESVTLVGPELSMEHMANLVIPASLESVVGPKLNMDDMAKLLDGLGEHTKTSSQEHAIEVKTKLKLEKVIYEHYGSSAELEMLAQLSSKMQGIELISKKRA